MPVARSVVVWARSGQLRSPSERQATRLNLGRHLAWTANALARYRRLVLAVSRLLTVNEQEAFGQELDSWSAGSSRWNEGMDEPSRYLTDLDPDVVATITNSVRPRLEDLRQRAAERGWELPV
jgi:hypothetical protein